MTGWCVNETAKKQTNNNKKQKNKHYISDSTVSTLNVMLCQFMTIQLLKCQKDKTGDILHFYIHTQIDLKDQSQHD